MTQRIRSCTTFLVGKHASIDGSAMIARNEDGGDTPNPQKFVVVHPDEQPTEFKAAATGTLISLPDKPLKYTSTPDADKRFGVWGAAGINQANVAMTATETITTNPRILGLDPLVPEGIGEADILSLVLPYIHTAKEGVLRLGQLLATYGTNESNGIAFSDQEDVWYMETLGGHRWAAIRIPDDAYVIATNRLNIDLFDFDSDDTLYSADLPEFIQSHQLNPDAKVINLRHIFGSSSSKDICYNNPRAWYVQRYFNPEIEQVPTDHELPFICRPAKKISIEDVKYVLSSHYQHTPFDPYGTANDATRKQLRPIGINRNLETHILQIRSNMPTDIIGIHWLAFGPNTFNALVPFYASVNQTPACYRETPTIFNPNYMFWLSTLTAVLGDSHYDSYKNLAMDTEQQVLAACRYIQYQTDQEYLNHAKTLPDLEAVNQKMADLAFAHANTLLGKMTEKGFGEMTLSFPLAD